MTRRPITAALVAAAAATTTVLTASPVQAATTKAPCAAGVTGTRVCVGIQTTGGDVRGYAKVSDVAGGADLNVNVRSVVLQRRACGGSWQAWTTVRNVGDTSGTSDTDTTAWVIFPSRVQFRTVATYSVESAKPPYTGRSGTATSGAYGSC
jgi:hypothetical protein